MLPRVDDTLQLPSCWDYYYLGNTVAGTYATEKKRLPCDTEERGMCEASLFHGSTILLTEMTQPDPDPSFVSMVNDLSPYIFPPTPFYTSEDGVIEVRFDHPVLVHGISLYGNASASSASLVSSFQIYYAYENSEVFNVTNFMEYHYSEEEYGDVSTLYTGFVLANATNTTSNGTTMPTTTSTTSTTTTTTTTTRPLSTTTTAPSSAFPEPPLVVHHQLRPFVATSVKIVLLEKPVQ
ncbi:uncharacterized protein LOC119584884 [Penaeus monodon]|uniref:uncharacterized protein LOC119584884 n=1 Tax=Penaeus monodon TaxID=6687 RepID=UPI0018A77942|nr:uncharacterized protein LOC119584884 [Penaeus monodon]